MYEHAKELAENLEQLAEAVEQHPDVERVEKRPVLTHEGHGEVTVYCSTPDTLVALEETVAEQVDEYEVHETGTAVVRVTVTEVSESERTEDTIQTVQNLLTGLRNHTGIGAVEAESLFDATAGVTFRVYSSGFESSEGIEGLVGEYADEYEVLDETSVTRGRFHNRGHTVHLNNRMATACRACRMALWPTWKRSWISVGSTTWQQSRLPIRRR